MAENYIRLTKGKGLEKIFSESSLPWLAIILFSIITIGLLVLGIGKITNYCFPLLALGVSIILYQKRGDLYLGFVIWLWFLTPLVRRLSDYPGGFTDPSPILLAPYLATFVAIMTSVNFFPRIFKKSSSLYIPFYLCLMGVLYGLMVGLIKNPVNDFLVIVRFLDWVIPIIFGLYIFTNWPQYPEYKKIITSVFLWGVVVMGTYGIIQYLTVPEWDAYWLTSSEFKSARKPVPMGIRIWSTCASPRPFGTIMMAGLLILTNIKSPIIIPSSIVGYLSFLLSFARAPWGGYIFSIFTLFSSLSPKQQMRLGLILILILSLVLPFILLDSFSGEILERLSTLASLEDDTSGQVRAATYASVFDRALTNFLGDGIGAGTFDSGLLAFPMNLGWFGTLPYLVGITILCIQNFKTPYAKKDLFMATCRCIAIATIAMLPLGTSMLAEQGIIMWTFLSLALAGQQYYHRQGMPRN
jgi:hypothetical protein